MTLVSVLLGLIAAVAVYLIGTALIAFPHSTLVFGLLAIVVFCVVAFGGATIPVHRRGPPA